MNEVCKKIHVVIADDHPLFIKGVESLLETAGHIVLVDKVPDGDSLLRCVASASQVDVVVLDLSMPGPPSEELIDALLAHNASMGLIALTMHANEHLALRLLKRGLSGYVLKDAAFDDLLHAIECVVSGEVFVSSGLVQEIKLLENDAQTVYLTTQEGRVLKEVSQGLSNKEVAQRLDISERTVRFHLGNCCEKLGAQSRTEAVTVARARRLI
ncbi:DNA-binding response regulator [Enterovibrio norvegicus]|uniref:Two component transcriptional regulator, LuxR family n=1 Tax=Enterovibrio norvegicus DSM 15893 TaxID=1121869 RepID=A0A1I5W8X4_9GAMM|nr:response regulator transcription factor [Enterovibrio norvegicus]MCC4798057.1 response regulator transcription factor [Enterovibrio norvegicus]OEF58613.1 DNA-binding response regulator [Enterovibrio norvegicus]OEF63830.1 DNA-binding response regulator [Enterovibrio norvegicus]PMH63652.1 DNA-binding response regulator [Enterovibrio norvegicus]PMI32519.1 DNA-binding response regulator [Enterovibrio norvegicus]